MELNKQSEKYLKAQERLTEIKKFYKHLIVYILVNLFFIGRRIYSDITYGDSWEDAFFDTDNYRFFFWWGIGLLLHAFNVFAKQNLFSKNWEARKIKQYMNEN